MLPGLPGRSELLTGVIDLLQFGDWKHFPIPVGLVVHECLTPQVMPRPVVNGPGRRPVHAFGLWNRTPPLLD